MVIGITYKTLKLKNIFTNVTKLQNFNIGKVNHIL